jgi:hypothetical protein
VVDDSGKLLLTCRATSGRPGTYPGEMWKPWDGPIPQGTYFLTPSEFSGVSGLRYILRNRIGLYDWGHWRVPLHPYPGTKTFGRSGFFLHGGNEPGSAGCIDVGHCDARIHDALKDHVGNVDVEVQYTNFKPF